MKELQIFNNNEFGKIRSLLINNEPYFVGNDIATVLGYKNTRDALSKHIDEEDKISDVAIHDGSQNRNMTIINESGLYSLILSSKLESAKKFKRWVTSEVLPTLRKEGTYTTKKRNKAIDKAIKQHFNIAQTIIQATGIKPGIAYSVAISEAEKETGYQYEEYKKLLPSADHDVASYNPTKLGEKLGIKAQEVNKRLETLGLQEKKEKKWRITEQGKQFGEEMPFTRNGHTDYRILWHENVLEKLGGTTNV